MAMAEIDGGTLSYQSCGEGEPLVMLLPQSTGPFGVQPLIELLSRRYRVITYDQRGTGRSSPAPLDMSMATQARDVIGLLDALDLADVSLLCHSTGCGIGLSVSAEQPSRIGHLVLAAPWTHGDDFLTNMQNLRKTAARSLDPTSYARFNAALLFPPAYRRDNRIGFDALAERAVAHPQDANDITRRLDAILAFDARALLPVIEAPTLVAVAADDQLMPSWFAHEMAEAIPGAKLVQLASGGHMFLETRAAEFGEAVLEFLR